MTCIYSSYKTTINETLAILLDPFSSEALLPITQDHFNLHKDSDERFWWWGFSINVSDTAQKMKFYIKDFFSKCDHICMNVFDDKDKHFWQQK